MNKFKLGVSALLLTLLSGCARDDGEAASAQRATDWAEAHGMSKPEQAALKSFVSVSRHGWERAASIADPKRRDEAIAAWSRAVAAASKAYAPEGQQPDLVELLNDEAEFTVKEKE